MDTTDMRVAGILGDAFRKAYGLDRKPADEIGEFAVRTVFRDGVERLGTRFTSLRLALTAADESRIELAAQNYGRTRVHVDVIDMNDGERRLDWDALEE